MSYATKKKFTRIVLGWRICHPKESYFRQKQPQLSILEKSDTLDAWKTSVRYSRQNTEVLNFRRTTWMMVK